MNKPGPSGIIFRPCAVLAGKANQFRIQRVHEGSLLNDDGDGYFTVVGVYRARTHTGAGMFPNPPLVVSRNRVGADAPTPTPATIPLTSNPKKRLTRRYPASSRPSLSSSATSTPTTTATSAQLVAPPALFHIPAPATPNTTASDPDALWAHILPFAGKYTKERNCAILQPWLQLPRVRDIELNEEFSAHFPWKVFERCDIISLIIYVTGTQAPTPCNYCRRQRGGIFPRCVMIADDAPIDLRKRAVACACCFYHHQHMRCSHRKMGMQKAGLFPVTGDEPDTPTIIPDEPQSVGEMPQDRKRKKKSLMATMKLSASLRRPADDSTEMQVDSPSVPTLASTRKRRATAMSTNWTVHTKTASNPTPPATTQRETTRLGGGAAFSGSGTGSPPAFHLLAAEAWESAPGVMHSREDYPGGRAKSKFSRFPHKPFLFSSPSRTKDKH
jgi:hypothetical protein